MQTRSCALLALFVFSLPLAAADNFYLKNGDRVVFYGDSITDQRLYTVLTETYVVTRYPKLDVFFVHSGWGGDKVSGGGGGPIDLRLDRDVIAYKPTVMTIMLGMNDGLYRAETEATDKAYFDGYRHIVEKMKAADPGIRITAIQPSPYDDVTRPPTFPGGYNEVMRSFGKWIANYANEANLQVADLNTPVVAMLRKADQLDPAEAQNIIKDRVHPGFAGHLIMAEGLLEAWHARPLVSSVTIEAGPKPKCSAEYANVSDLASANGGLRWTETEEALPLPFSAWKNDKWTSGPLDLVLRSSDVSQALNNEPLKVGGLKSGVYTLKIDGQSIGNFNNDELARGINLALLDTPMAKQAQEVYELTVAHCNVHNDRWRNVQVPLAPYNLPAVQSAMQSADELERAILQKRSQAAQPKPHQFELAPAA
ncbi:MAG TPA: SGNH/GDSL hydrolase family protein [Bryobacteraceae bacterium]|jgi:lysophospholipase L1-like esterase|nr:SGNH/GDSL hydrolase family protein [Bryobacteraceae bacterium]